MRKNYCLRQSQGPSIIRIFPRSFFIAKSHPSLEDSSPPRHPITIESSCTLFAANLETPPLSTQKRSPPPFDPEDKKTSITKIRSDIPSYSSTTAMALSKHHGPLCKTLLRYRTILKHAIKQSELPFQICMYTTTRTPK